MKKLFILLLALICLVGCGKKEDEEYTDYINNSKSESFISLIKTYGFSARNEVNSGKYNVYDESTLFLIPAGDNKKYSCLMSDTTSFVKWKYLYIGIQYSNYSYNYYAIGEEEDGHGVSFVNTSELSVNDLYTSSRLNEEGYDILQRLYTTSGNNITYSPVDNSNDYSKISKILPIANNSYKKIVIVGSKECKY